MPEPTGLLADVSLDLSAPFAGRDATWSAAQAKKALREWATKSNGELDEDKYARAFLWRPAGQPPSNFKLPVATVEGGKLKIVFRALAAAAAALHQGGGRSVALSPGELRQVRSAVEQLYEKAAKSFKDDAIRAPWTKAAITASMVRRGAALEESLADVHGWRPPAEHFEPFPEDKAPHGVRIASDGRISGYLATWDGLIGSNCHLGYLADGECFVPPRSPDGAFPHFHQNNTPLELSNGEQIMPGILVTDIGHGDPNEDDQAERINHYEDPDAIVGPVVAGQDDRGIYLAGSAREAFMKDKDRVVLANLARYSGHWEEIDDVMELIGAVGVNWPGFSNPNASGPQVAASMAAGRRLAASGLRAATVAGADRPYRLVAAAALELGLEAQQMLADVIGVELPADAAPVLLDSEAAAQIRAIFTPPEELEEAPADEGKTAAVGDEAEPEEEVALEEKDQSHVDAIARALGIDPAVLTQAIVALTAAPIEEMEAAIDEVREGEPAPDEEPADEVELDDEVRGHIDELAKDLDLNVEDLTQIVEELAAMPDDEARTAALPPFTRAVRTHLAAAGMDPDKAAGAAVLLVQKITQTDGIPPAMKAKAYQASIVWNSRRAKGA